LPVRPCFPPGAIGTQKGQGPRPRWPLESGSEPVQPVSEFGQRKEIGARQRRLAAGPSLAAAQLLAQSSDLIFETAKALTKPAKDVGRFTIPLQVSFRSAVSSS
jgi:hypothetical protein